MGYAKNWRVTSPISGAWSRILSPPILTKTPSLHSGEIRLSPSNRSPTNRSGNRPPSMLVRTRDLPPLPLIAMTPLSCLSRVTQPQDTRLTPLKLVKLPSLRPSQDRLPGSQAVPLRLLSSPPLHGRTRPLLLRISRTRQCYLQLHFDANRIVGLPVTFTSLHTNIATVDVTVP